MSALRTVRSRPACAVFAIVMALTGCGRPIQPVSETDWRNHLSLPPARISRNWALPDNTMLVELGHTLTDQSDVVVAYSYEVFDPKTDSAAEIIPVRYDPVIRKVENNSVEFVCNGDYGLPYLTIYDIATRKTLTRIPGYTARTSLQFGLTNEYTYLRSVQTGAVGITLSMEYAESVPFMRISGDGQSKTLIVQLPGLAAPQSALGETSVASGLIESVSVVAGMNSRYGGQTRGTTIRIKTQAADWDKLTYSIIATDPGTSAEFTIQVSEGGSPADVSLLLDPPEASPDWRLRMEQDIYRIESTIKLADGTALVKVTNGQTWALYDFKSRLHGLIVGEADWPVLSKVTDREVQFLCTGVGPPSFPYLTVYDIETRSIVRRDVHAALAAPIEFGSPYSFVFASCTPDAEGIALGVREGSVMAGGGQPPATRTRADEASHSFYVEFPGTTAEELSFGPVDPQGTPFVESICLSDGVRGPDGKAAPGATLRLVLDSAKWRSLTYSIGYHVDENGNPGPGLILSPIPSRRPIWLRCRASRADEHSGIRCSQGRFSSAPAICHHGPRDPRRDSCTCGLPVAGVPTEQKRPERAAGSALQRRAGG